MAGIKIKVDEEGVKMLNITADSVEEGADDIIELTSNLLDDVQQCTALGPHEKTIKDIVAVIQEKTKGTAAPVRVVVEKLRQKATEYQEWIDEDLFGDQGN